MKQVVRMGFVLAAMMLGSTLSGCVFLGDFLAPDVASSLGVPVPAQSIGSIVVRVRNDSNETAVMSVLAGSATNFSPLASTLGPSGEENFVLDCPIGFIFPAGTTAGVITSDPAQPAASVIAADGMTVDIPFTGSVLDEADFNCGDVIEVRLIQVGVDVAAENFVVTVQVLRGT